MLDQLKAFDYRLFSWVNGVDIEALDRVMILLSDKVIWIPLYLFIVYHIAIRFGRKLLVPIILLLICLAVSDQVTSSFMKPFFERLRPCHDPMLTEVVRVVKGCGGKFGFASSHAANTMGLAIGTILLLGIRWSLLVIWAFFVAFSRIYLGVHFPGDVLVGSMVGLLIALIIFSSFGLYSQRHSNSK